MPTFLRWWLPQDPRARPIKQLRISTFWLFDSLNPATDCTPDDCKISLQSHMLVNVHNSLLLCNEKLNHNSLLIKKKVAITLHFNDFRHPYYMARYAEIWCTQLLRPCGLLRSLYMAAKCGLDGVVLIRNIVYSIRTETAKTQTEKETKCDNIDI